MTVAPRDGLGVFAGYHSPQVDVPIRLNTNESPFSPPGQLLAAWTKAVGGMNLNRYPDRSAKGAIRAIADFHGVSPEQVFIANGSNEVLQSILLGYGGDTRVAASFEPTYAMYETIARVTSTPYVALERDSRLLVDLNRGIDDLKVSKADLVFVCTPNNPTGLLEESGLVDTLLGRFGSLVVVDEAYGQFNDESSVPLIQRYDNLVVVRTFSKIWSLAGMRIGYAIADKKIIETLWRVALPYHLDASKALLAELSFDYIAEMEERVSFLISERERVQDRFGSLDLSFWPSATNFILFRPKIGHGHRLWELLLERGVLVRDWSRWPRLDDCLRVTIGTKAENDAFLAALEESLELL